MRILIVKLGSIGDVVHTLPALQVMSDRFPHASIAWAVERSSSEILRDNPLLDNLIEIDTRALRRWPVFGETLLAPRQQLRRLRASAFDIALDFQGLAKSALVARLSGAAKRFGYARESLREPVSRFLLTNTVEIPSGAHAIEKALFLAAGALGVTVPAKSAIRFPISIHPRHQDEAQAALEHTGNPFAILNPAGGWPTKLWSPERFGLLADELWTQFGMRSIVTHGPGEARLADLVLQSNRGGRAIKASLSLKAFAALCRMASLYVGGDTGPTHVAAAMGTPVVGLYGPTEWWRNGSFNPDDIPVERTDIACRTDCNRRSCSRWICMDIHVESVLNAVSERLARTKVSLGASEFVHA